MDNKHFIKNACDTADYDNLQITRFELGGFYACENGDGYHCEKIDRGKNIISFSADSSIQGYVFDCILRANDETEYSCRKSEEDLPFEQLSNMVRANNLF